MSRRTERLSKLIKQELSVLLAREVSDPRLNNLISVTGVTILPDLRHAKVLVSILGGEVDKAEMIAGFNAASGFLRKKLAPRLRMRCIPELSFHYDDTIESGAKVLEVINRVAGNK